MNVNIGCNQVENRLIYKRERSRNYFFFSIFNVKFSFIEKLLLKVQFINVRLTMGIFLFSSIWKVDRPVSPPFSLRPHDTSHRPAQPQTQEWMNIYSYICRGAGTWLSDLWDSSQEHRSLWQDEVKNDCVLAGTESRPLWLEEPPFFFFLCDILPWSLRGCKVHIIGLQGIDVW